MKTFEISAKITVCSYEELNQAEKNVIDNAKTACHSAYAPYSQYHVGAAVLLENGKIITGNNQENIAYPSGLCAERVAVYYANALFPDVKIKTIAIAAYHQGEYVQNISPCGSCRQVLLETENRFKSPVRILLYGKNETRIVESVNDLMPLSFSQF